MTAGISPEALRLALFGTPEPEPEVRRLKAGPLSAELIEGNLRNIRFHGVEVLRAISFVVRDKDWGTYAPTLHDLTVEEGEGRFAVRYRADCVGPGGERLVYKGRIEGRPTCLVFEGEAVPEGDFLTNRCGFTVLHPIVGLAGTEVEVEHVDGRRVVARLPELIDPAQPFKDMRAISHAVAPGVRATCRMEGDAFEMEDQRNWSDASYKTYVRPLALPWPYVLPAGAPGRQRVTLDIAAEGAVAPTPRDDAPVVLTPGATRGRLPLFGLVIAPDQAAATCDATDELAALAPQELLFHFDPTAGHGPAELAAFARLAGQGGASVLEYVVPCARPLIEEFSDLARQVAAAGLRLDALAVSPAVDRRSTPPGSVWPRCPPLEEVYEAARRAFPALRLGGGMFSYFTELNRKRPPVALLDYVTHCTCPIVHDADDRAVMQSLEALPFILRSARAFIGADMPYRIGPSTIGMRHNPYGARVMPNPERRRMPMAERDPRQDGLFAAAYLVGMAARLAEAGVESFTGAALTGPFGLLAEDAPARRRPVFHTARWLAALGGAPAISVASADPARVLALAGATPAGDRVLLAANLTPQEQSVTLPFPGRAQLLDVAAVLGGAGPRPVEAGAGSLLLPAYAVLRLEG
ncbi:D-apionate lactonase [Ancylobacter sp.]|uniref:D-apionate lactonase n=1 Tax=Ancylobacter sp. TaxID=1872567 RepID=UPI003C7E3784